MKIESKKSIIALKGAGLSLQIQPCSLQFIGICLQKCQVLLAENPFLFRKDRKR
ncbi:MAG: hypothetical protein IJT61_05825 [Bacteroidales bacterium]|nr:hypothetical protein [Bacteroidales bacterium]